LGRLSEQDGSNFGKVLVDAPVGRLEFEARALIFGDLLEDFAPGESVRSAFQDADFVFI
jgi:hypothetical protein